MKNTKIVPEVNLSVKMVMSIGWEQIKFTVKYKQLTLKDMWLERKLELIIIFVLTKWG